MSQTYGELLHSAHSNWQAKRQKEQEVSSRQNSFAAAQFRDRAGNRVRDKDNFFANQESDKQRNWQQLLRLLAFCSSVHQTGQGQLIGKKGRVLGDGFAMRLHHYQQIDIQAARLLAQMQEPVPTELEQLFKRLCADFLEGVPLPYIWGVGDFSDYSFATGPGVLIPREDSGVLLEQGLVFCRSLKNENHRSSGAQIEILELCCGTACISLSLYLKLLEEGSSPKIWASDISAEALVYAEQNWAHYLEDGTSDFQSFHLYQSDLFGQPDLQRSYDLILANPPYLSEQECFRRNCWHEPMSALKAGADGLDLLRRIILQAPNFLKPGGILMLEAAPWQIYELHRLLEASGYEQCQSHCDGAGLERMIRAQYLGAPPSSGK